MTRSIQPQSSPPPNICRTPGRHPDGTCRVLAAQRLVDRPDHRAVQVGPVFVPEEHRNVEPTRRAPVDGADAIAQAWLADGRWIGRADVGLADDRD